MKNDLSKVIISGSGGYLPGKPISNIELGQRSGMILDDEKIFGSIGIKFRHFAADGEGASVLAAEAAKKAITRSGIKPTDLDRIIFCSSTADWTSPAAASNVQRLLGADCPAEDKQVACASFVFGLDHGIRLIQTGQEHVLVVSGEVKSRFVRKNDPKLLPIFADGAGAVVLSRRNKNSAGEFIDCVLWTDGGKIENMITPAGGSAMPASIETVSKDLHSTRMQVEGRVIYEDAVEKMTELSLDICVKNHLKLEDIALFIPHQANLKIMQQVAKNLSLPESKVVNTIHMTGNIVSATIPFSLDYADREGKIKKGDIVLMTTVGAGYAGGSVLYRY